MPDRAIPKSAELQMGPLWRQKRRRASQIFAGGIVGTVALMGAIAVAGFALTRSDQLALNAVRHTNRDIRCYLLAMVDAETSVRGYVLTGQPDYLEPFESGLRVINAAPASLITQLGTVQVPAGPGNLGDTPAPVVIARLREVWGRAIALAGQQKLQAAEAVLMESHAKDLMDRARAFLGNLLAMRDAEASETERHITSEGNVVLLLNLLGAALTISAMTYAVSRSIRNSGEREQALEDHTAARKQVELLFVMAEMLQSAIDREDANEVLRATGTRLLPGMAGALYVFNNSRDRLDLSTTWSAADTGELDRTQLADHLTPGSCWALKRGKPHRNEQAAGALRCAHAPRDAVSLELPMAARGELYGLLCLSAEGDDAEARLTAIQPIAAALADAMSLALSSITLRERLRNQALRDPLTSLYNRRFLEEMMERLSQDAERRRVPLSAIMLDLDHFKVLNDQFGHATGDAVLRQVASTVMASLRAADVACRYGGEELAILLPDCGLDEAAAKAELIRTAIAAMAAEGRTPPVTASLGVASVPGTTARAADLLQAADGALYSAKQQGRDRVICAPARQSAPMLVVAG